MTSCSIACTWAGTAPGPERDVEDRVADELAGAVVGDVAAAVGLHELGADRLGVRRARARPWPARRGCKRAGAPGGAGIRPYRPLQRALLQDVGVPVADPPEPADAELAAGRRSELGRPVTGLDQLAQIVQECRGVGAVDGAVVERERQHADRVDPDRLASRPAS